MHMFMKLAPVALSVVAMLMSAPAQAAPSFDCAKAGTRVERMICDDRKLAELDSDLADAYAVALRDSPWASANRRIRAEQKDWIAERNGCGDVRCLRRSYHRRISALYGEVNNGDSGGAPAQTDPSAMMALCRDRAAHVFHVRQPNVETKYEGQRADGTHAVNGTAYLRGVDETFQCSFSADGRQIERFVVN